MCHQITVSNKLLTLMKAALIKQKIRAEEFNSVVAAVGSV